MPDARLVAAAETPDAGPPVAARDPADADEGLADEETEAPGGRHTVSPGRITRSAETPLVASSFDIDTPARVAMSHQPSPDSTVYVGAFDGEHDDAGVAPGGRHTTSPGWMTTSVDASFVSSNDRTETCARFAMPNHVSPPATRWLASPEAAQVDVVCPSGAAVTTAGIDITDAPTAAATASRAVDDGRCRDPNRRTPCRRGSSGTDPEHVE